MSTTPNAEKTPKKIHNARGVYPSFLARKFGHRKLVIFLCMFAKGDFLLSVMIFSISAWGFSDRLCAPTKFMKANPSPDLTILGLEKISKDLLDLLSYFALTKGEHNEGGGRVFVFSDCIIIQAKKH
jgi:hypothetical protein